MAAGALTYERNGPGVPLEETTTIKALRDWGLEPIPISMWHFAPFGGSFHCATLDVRRRGGLESYY